MKNVNSLMAQLRLRLLMSWFRWWMASVALLVAALGLVLFSIIFKHADTRFEPGDSRWVLVTSLLHLPYVMILLFQMASTIERLGFYWRGRMPERPGKMPAEYPTVCVQLPVFNDYAVARRVIEAAAKMQWPRDRLFIQVLDDSSNEETRHLVEQVCHEVWWSGIEYCIIHRNQRRGYKAGALEEGRRQTDSEFLIIFEPHFVPPSDFLLRTIPHFYLEDGTPDCGLAQVQAQRGMLNHHQSVLSQSQSLWLDNHYTLQMAWRSAVWKFVALTGTASVWRASAIETAGGWRPTSLVEDCELSFRQLFAGYRTKFVKEVVVPGELPVTFTTYKAQQKRWTQGWVQLQRLHLWTLLFEYPSAWVRRLYLLYHMCTSWQWPLWMLWSLLLPFLIYHGCWFGVLGETVGVVVYLAPSVVWASVAAVTASLETGHAVKARLTPLRFLARVGRVFPFIIINIGLLPHQFSAFIEGLFGPLNSERVPKSGFRLSASVQSSASRQGYIVRSRWPYIFTEVVFIVLQLAWGVLFLEAGLIGCAAAALCLAACVGYVACLYDDDIGKVRCELERIKVRRQQ